MVGEAEGGGVGFSTDQLDMSNTGLEVGEFVGCILQKYRSAVV